MSDYFDKMQRNIIDQIQYRGTMVTGEITKDNGDGTYAVKIALADKAYPHVETAFPNMVFGIDEIVLITFEYGNKEMPRILGYAKRIVQHPVDVECDYSGEGGDPITTVKTLDAYSIIFSVAYLEGKISLSRGTGNCTRRGFQYGLTTAYGSDIHTDGSYGSGDYALQISRLANNTTHHFRAYVIDADGNVQTGEDKTFNTLMANIYIGNPAIDWGGIAYPGYTYVTRVNPANATGKILSIELWVLALGFKNCKIATFYEVGDNYLSTRDTEFIGDVPGDSTLQIINVNLNVAAGDYIGIYFENAFLSYWPASSEGKWILEGDQIPCTNVLFDLSEHSGLYSLYGLGQT